MVAKLVKKKEKAFLYGTQKMNELKNEYLESSTRMVNDQMKELFGTDGNSGLLNKFIGLNADDVTKFLYNNSKFYEYVKYSFIAKYYEKKLNSIHWVIILLFLLVGGGLYFLLGFSTVFIILAIVLVALLIYILISLKTGESYSSYYNRTMVSFLCDVYHNLNFNINGSKLVNDIDIRNVIRRSFDRKYCSDNIDFTGNTCSGNILDLKLERKYERSNKDGSTSTYYKKFFDGFYLKVNTLNTNNLLRGNSIIISSDENIFSSLAEDTVKGIYESEREISFNSEEMNKSFDARVSGYSGFESIDDMMIAVQKILTPSFEQHLLYLRERYNTFSMIINDDGFIMAVNMERSLFQKAKHNELLDFTTTYREANENFRMLKGDVIGIDDFAYYNVFPFLERLYLINYLTYLYLSYMDFDNYYSINNGHINSYEESMKNIYTMDNKEFKEIYTDKIKEIKNQVKDLIVSFEKEVDNNG